MIISVHNDDSNIIVQQELDGCQHTFHTRCIKQWLLDRDDCPICRSSFGIGDDDVRRVYSKLEVKVMEGKI